MKHLLTLHSDIDTCSLLCTLRLAAQPNQEAEQTLEERIAEIESTFDTINTPLAELKHPTKSHLEAVDSYEILPDEDLWGNQFALFRFTENPMDIKRLGGVSALLVTPRYDWCMRVKC